MFGFRAQWLNSGQSDGQEKEGDITYIGNCADSNIGAHLALMLCSYYTSNRIKTKSYLKFKLLHYPPSNNYSPAVNKVCGMEPPRGASPRRLKA